MTERIVETINPADHSTVAIYLINTMSREAKHVNLLEHFKIKRVVGDAVTVDVELLINGVPVDFQKSIEEMWERLSSRYNEDVLEKAKQMLSNTRLGKLNDLLDNATWQIEEELNTLFKSE